MENSLSVLIDPISNDILIAHLIKYGVNDLDYYIKLGDDDIERNACIDFLFGIIKNFKKIEKDDEDFIKENFKNLYFIMYATESFCVNKLEIQFLLSVFQRNICMISSNNIPNKKEIFLIFWYELQEIIRYQSKLDDTNPKSQPDAVKDPIADTKPPFPDPRSPHPSRISN